MPQRVFPFLILSLLCTLSILALSTTWLFKADIAEANVVGTGKETQPSLVIANHLTATVGMTVTVPIIFSANDAQISAAGFSIDFDETCLTLDESDHNADGRPDSIVIDVPVAFTDFVFYDATDTDGEIDIGIVDLSLPFESLSDGVWVLLEFSVICQPTPGEQRSASIHFATVPAPGFSNPTTQPVAVELQVGAVQVIADQSAATITPSPTPTTTPTPLPTGGQTSTLPPFNPNADPDRDGILNGQEDVNGNGNPTDDDSDSDGLPNYLDPDDDGDGVSTLLEGERDTDGDQLPDYLDDDDDGDTIPTIIDGAADTDSDVLRNYLDPDDDGDGIPTRVEGMADRDNDGLPNYLDPDDDGDGVPTLVEGNIDTDGDGTRNYLDFDDDGDGIPTRVEGAGDSDHDTTPDYLDLDDDGDGVPTAIEGSDDSNGNGIPNYLDPSDIFGDRGFRIYIPLVLVD